MANPWRIRAEHRAATQFHELGLLISDAFNSSTIVKSSKYLEFRACGAFDPSSPAGSHQVCAPAEIFIRRNTSGFNGRCALLF